jgi:aarF domain-containing kinase
MNLIDAGLIVEMNRKDRRNFIELFSAVLMNDGLKAGHLMVERSRTGVCKDKDGFAVEMNEIVSDVHKSGLNFRKVSVSELLGRVMHACYKHQVKLESKFISVVLAMTILEGLGRRLNPDADLMLAAGPYIAKAAAKMILDEATHRVQGQ